MKVLLIEDSKFQRIANGRALVKAGYCVIHAGDGEEGLRCARENVPDLILLDFMLPKVSGVDVLRTLKGDALLKHIPVVVLSGVGQANETKLMKVRSGSVSCEVRRIPCEQFIATDSGVGTPPNRSQSLDA
jgi:DNA-binding response OmpR family regulator